MKASEKWARLGKISYLPLFAAVLASLLTGNPWWGWAQLGFMLLNAGLYWRAVCALERESARHQARQQAEEKMRLSNARAARIELEKCKLEGQLEECQHQLEDFTRVEAEDMMTMGGVGKQRTAREFCAEIRRIDKAAADMAIDLGEARGYAAKLEDLLFAEVWRRHAEKADREEAGF